MLAASAVSAAAAAVSASWWAAAFCPGRIIVTSFFFAGVVVVVEFAVCVSLFTASTFLQGDDMLSSSIELLVISLSAVLSSDKHTQLNV